MDALVYALAAPVLRAPTPSQNLRNRLSSYTELVRFVEGVSGRYFPRLAAGASSDQQRVREGGDVDEKGSESSEGGSTVVVNWFLPLLVASFAMTAYASRTGLFHHLHFMKRG